MKIPAIAAVIAIAVGAPAMTGSAFGEADSDPGQVGPVGSAASELAGIVPASAHGRAVLAAHGRSPNAGSPQELLEHPALGAPHDRRILYDRLHSRSEHADLEPGRNIARDGVVGGDGLRAATWREVEDGIEALRRDQRRLAERRAKRSTDAATSASVEQTGAPAGAAGGGGAAGSGLESIAACESGGDPSAVDATGTYRGKYQFDQQTWQSVGGTGDPAAAPEAEQDRRASTLMQQRGGSPWPNC